MAQPPPNPPQEESPKSSEKTNANTDGGMRVATWIIAIAAVVAIIAGCVYFVIARQDDDPRIRSNLAFMESPTLNTPNDILVLERHSIRPYVEPTDSQRQAVQDYQENQDEEDFHAQYVYIMARNIGNSRAENVVITIRLPSNESREEIVQTIESTTNILDEDEALFILVRICDPPCDESDFEGISVSASFRDVDGSNHNYDDTFDRNRPLFLDPLG